MIYQSSTIVCNNFSVKYNNFTLVGGFDFDAISSLLYYYKPALLNFSW